MELIQLLTQNLGIQEEQAKGGAGLLFQFAQQQMSQQDFSKLAQSVPGIENLIQQSSQAIQTASQAGIHPPQPGDIAGAISQFTSQFSNNASQTGGIASMMSQLASSAMGAPGNPLANLGSLVGGFHQLGIDPQTAANFIPVVLTFVENQGGDEAKTMLANIFNHQ